MRARAREDATQSLPAPGDTNPSAYERELQDANAQQAGNVVEDVRKTLEEIDAKIKAKAESAAREFRAANALIESEYQAELARIGSTKDNPLLDKARKQVEFTEKAFGERRANLKRLPLEYIPHKMYLALAILIGLGEVPLNAMVFGIFGENQVTTWIMSFVIGIFIPLTAHFVGIKVREHGEKFSWGNAAKAVAVFLFVAVALYGLTILRQTYLGEIRQDLGFSERIVEASFSFFWLNIGVFLAAILVAYLAHDPVPGYAQLYRHYQEAVQELDSLLKKQAETEKSAAMTKAQKVQKAEQKKANDMAEVKTLEGRYNSVLMQGREQEARWLDQLGRDLEVYRGENLQWRQDRKRPPCFDLNLDFPLELGSIKEKLDNAG
jgi:hypothetical protein